MAKNDSFSNEKEMRQLVCRALKIRHVSGMTPFHYKGLCPDCEEMHMQINEVMLRTFVHLCIMQEATSEDEVLAVLKAFKNAHSDEVAKANFFEMLKEKTDLN